MKMKPFVVALAIAGGAVGCADRPFVRADPPVSNDGVTVALVGQKCGREAWYENYDVLDLDMVIRVTNQTSEAISVVPSQMRLLARGNSTVPRSSKPKWEDAPSQVQPNASADIRIHFQRWGNAKCDHEMQMSLDRSMEMSGRNVAVQPLSFVATRTDT